MCDRALERPRQQTVVSGREERVWRSREREGGGARQDFVVVKSLLPALLLLRASQLTLCLSCLPPLPPPQTHRAALLASIGVWGRILPLDRVTQCGLTGH